jgi:hypothetical protein
MGMDRTPCRACNSFDKFADMSVRRASECAEKCAFRDLRLDDATDVEYFILPNNLLIQPTPIHSINDSFIPHDIQKSFTHFTQ